MFHPSFPVLSAIPSNASLLCFCLQKKSCTSVFTEVVCRGHHFPSCCEDIAQRNSTETESHLLVRWGLYWSILLPNATQSSERCSWRNLTLCIFSFKPPIKQWSMNSSYTPESFPGAVWFGLAEGVWPQNCERKSKLLEPANTLECFLPQIMMVSLSDSRGLEGWRKLSSKKLCWQLFQTTEGNKVHRNHAALGHWKLTQPL